MKVIESNYIDLQEVISKKYMEIATTLESFDGRLSLSEVLNTEIPLLNKLKSSRNELYKVIKEQVEKENKRGVK